jgi:diaminopimelate decarboxylase
MPARHRPIPRGFRLAAEAGVGIDVASPCETRCALEAGVPSEKLDVNGNSKDDGLLNLAIDKDMLIIIDSIAELERIAQLANNHAAAARDVARHRVPPRQGHIPFDLHRRRVEQIRHPQLRNPLPPSPPRSTAW